MPVEIYFTMKNRINEKDLKELFIDYEDNVLNAKGTTV
jgi:hypothetical protein